MDTHLEIAVNEYDEMFKREGIQFDKLNDYVLMTNTAYAQGDIEAAIDVSKKTKKYLNLFIDAEVRSEVGRIDFGEGFKILEEACQDAKQSSDRLDLYYGVLLLEAPYLLDSFELYIERTRARRERFYEPRRKTLLKVTSGLQRLEDDALDELFIHMPARVGKLVADDTPVFTSAGWKNHGDLKAGDYVVGSDGNYTKVVKVFPKHYTTHTVTFSDGSKIECHANHEWTVYDKRCQGWKTYETHEMIGRLTLKERDKKGVLVDRKMIYLPKRSAVHGVHKDFELHPYVLGAWLGDGTNKKPWITDPKSDDAIIEKIQKCGVPLKKYYIHKKTGVYSYVFGDELRQPLKKYDMCFSTKRCEKHIPTAYLTASVEQRLELLAGLLDTDGTLIKKEKRYNFSTISKRLRDDVVTLINSFGWRVCVMTQKPHISSSGIVGKHDCYVIAFNPDRYIPCALPRKQLYEYSAQRRISIVSIKESPAKQGNCISVANKDGLYAVGKNMILTHNSQELTMAFAWHCARDMEASNLYVTYKEGLGGAFLDGIKEIYTDPIYRFADVFPDVKIVDTDAKNNKLDLGRVKKYKSLSGKGMESGLNGEYDAYGWLGMDDMYEGIQDVLSEDIRKRKQKIFNNNVIKRAKENCKKIWNGTIWSLDDIFMNRQRFLDENPEAQDIRYEIIKIPALDPETDESNFNYDYGVGFTTKHYRMERAKFEADDDMASWWAQDQQEPIERDGQVFDPDRMNYYSVLPDGEPLKIAGHCDSALGGGDYVSFPIAYVYEDDTGDEVVYIEDVVFDNSEKHITQPQVVEKIKRHNMKNVHFESNQGGEGYKDEVEKMLSEDKTFNKGKPINITSSWAPVQKRKAQRIWDNAQEIRQFYFKDPQHRDAQYRKFMQNLFSFSMNMKRKAHDDAPDSLAGLVDFLHEGSGVSMAKITRGGLL